jgi:hypothetical protein
MTSLYDAQELPGLQAELASLNAEFRNWLCWPDPGGGWYVLELGFWFRDTDQMYLFKASSPAEVREWLRDFEQHAHAWQAARLAMGLPAGDPPVSGLPLVTAAMLSMQALTASMNQAVTGLMPPDRPPARPLPGLPVPGWIADLPWSRAAGPGDRPVDSRWRQRRRPAASGPGRTHRDHQ